MAEHPLLAMNAVRFGFRGCPVFLGPVSLEIRPGEVIGIIGPNGAGKSTLLKLMAGLLSPIEGEASLNGESLQRLSRRNRAKLSAYLPQKPEAPPSSSVIEVVLAGRYARRSFGLFESAEDEAAVQDVMRLTGTDSFAQRSMETLSGGESQRVFLAAALAASPAILLLDEPTSALDLRHQRRVLEILRQQASGQGPAVVMVLHDLNHAEHFCDRVALLDGGTLAGWGTPQEVFRQDRLEAVYRVRFDVHEQHGHRWLLPYESIDSFPTE